MGLALSRTVWRGPERPAEDMGSLIHNSLCLPHVTHFRILGNCVYGSDKQEKQGPCSHGLHMLPEKDDKEVTNKYFWRVTY